MYNIIVDKNKYCIRSFEEGNETVFKSTLQEAIEDYKNGVFDNNTGSSGWQKASSIEALLGIFNMKLLATLPELPTKESHPEYFI